MSSLSRGDWPDLSKVRTIITDLDGTFFPGVSVEAKHYVQHITENDALPGFNLNLAMANELIEKLGIEIVPATGNNVLLAQAKFNLASASQKWDLNTQPGIYCNGSLVLGKGGEVLSQRSLKEIVANPPADLPNSEGKLESLDGTRTFLATFMKKWLGVTERGVFTEICVVGFTRDAMNCLDSSGGIASSTAPNSTTYKEICGHFGVDGVLRTPEEFVNTHVLSLALICPKSFNDANMLELQTFLHAEDLVCFRDPEAETTGGGGPGIAGAQRLVSGEPTANFHVVAKHVHVPGMGPEIDIVPGNTNKGTGVLSYIAHCAGTTSLEKDTLEVAVFGDAGNDIELFGSSDGTFRPAVRVAMPWTNAPRLMQDATICAKMHSVLAKIYEAQSNGEKLLGGNFAE